ncbi:MAG: MFS transporter [Alphaproteobacteria bacterium]|nr:MFS transporter [Alphaproteobacteria bacterium]
MQLAEPEVRAAIAGAMTMMFLAALETTIVSTALPTIAADLGDVHLLSWVVTSYLLTSTCSTPIAGKLGDLYGRRRMLHVALAVFLVASVLCALSTTMLELALARALQGAGGGALITSAQTAVADVVAPRERGRYSVYLSIVWGASSLIGPTLGGILAQNPGWPWIFWLNLPIGVAALLYSDRALRRLPIHGRKAPLDLAGILLLAAGTLLVLLALSLGGTRFPWASTELIAGAATGAALLFVFGLRQIRISDPILPPRFFRDGVVGPTLAAIFLSFGAYLVVAVLSPIFFQVGLQIAPATVGLLMMPMMVSSTYTAWVAGRYTKTHGGYRRPPFLGLPVAAAALALLALFAERVSAFEATVLLTIFGFGIGPIFPVTMVAAQNAVERRDLGAVTGAIGFARALGAAMLIAAASALMLALIVAWVPDMTGLSSLDELVRRPLSGPARAEVAQAYGVMLWAIVGVLAASLVAFALVEARPLKTTMD